MDDKDNSCTFYHWQQILYSLHTGIELPKESKSYLKRVAENMLYPEEEMLSHEAITRALEIDLKKFNKMWERGNIFNVWDQGRPGERTTGEFLSQDEFDAVIYIQVCRMKKQKPSRSLNDIFRILTEDSRMSFDKIRKAYRHAKKAHDEYIKDAVPTNLKES